MRSLRAKRNEAKPALTDRDRKYVIVVVPKETPKVNIESMRLTVAVPSSGEFVRQAIAVAVALAPNQITTCTIFGDADLAYRRRVRFAR